MSNIHEQSGMNGCFGAAVLKISSTAEEFNVSAVPIVIDGVSALLAADTTAPITAHTGSHTTLAGEETCIFLIVTTLAGVKRAVQSEILTTAQLDEGRAFEMPEVPADNVLLGYIKVSTNASGAFIPVTDAFSDSNVFDEFVSFIGGMSGRAITGTATGYTA